MPNLASSILSLSALLVYFEVNPRHHQTVQIAHLSHFFTVSLNRGPSQVHTLYLVNVSIKSLLILSSSSSLLLLPCFLAIYLLKTLGCLWAMFWLGHLTCSSMPCLTFNFLVKIHHGWWLVVLSPSQLEGSMPICLSFPIVKSEQWVQTEAAIIKVPHHFFTY